MQSRVPMTKPADLSRQLPPHHGRAGLRTGPGVGGVGAGAIRPGLAGLASLRAGVGEWQDHQKGALLRVGGKLCIQDVYRPTSVCSMNECSFLDWLSRITAGCRNLPDIFTAMPSQMRGVWIQVPTLRML